MTSVLAQAAVGGDAWQCGEFLLPLGAKTYVMAVVNTTPDSFSDDGVLGQAAIDRAWKCVETGCDILDIGGESTRPGARPVTAQQEMDRLLPVVEALAGQVPVPISVDTSKAEVAVAAIAAGASIINDISGGTFDDEMLATLGSSRCGYVLMHLRGTPAAMDWSRRHGPEQEDAVAEVLDFWRGRLAAAAEAGIATERVALDPGFGFGKSLQENLELVRRGRELAQSGRPLLIGVSRKSSLGKIMGDKAPADRMMGSVAAAALAVAAGYDIVRVHDVAETLEVVRVADAISREK